MSTRGRGQRGEPHAPRKTVTRPDGTGGRLSIGDLVDDGKRRDSDELMAEREPRDKERKKIPILT